MSRIRRQLIGALMAAAVLAMVGQALGAANGSGDLVVSFEADLVPKTLPRDRAVPVAVTVGGRVRSVSGNLDALPQLRRIKVGINREGRLFDRGLPVCRAWTIRPARPERALEVCGEALVGHGRVSLRAHLDSQPPLPVKARLLAFNGPKHGGERLILVHAFAAEPPGSFLLVFRVRREPGEFGTTLSTSLPKETRGWAYLVSFELTLRRTFTYRGKRRSYVSAACRAPVGFRSVLFPFAWTEYRFAGGPTLTMSETASCRVAGE